MKLFRSLEAAAEDMQAQDRLLLPRRCPLNTRDYLCGNWCPFFEVANNSTYGPRVELHCRPQVRHISVEADVVD